MTDRANGLVVLAACLNFSGSLCCYFVQISNFNGIDERKVSQKIARY